MTTQINRLGRNLWEWLGTDSEGHFLFGGYCRTKRDAASDLKTYLASR